MNETMLFRRAVVAECDRILQLIEQGRRQIALTGSDQWQDGYPDRESILGDIASEVGYVLTQEDVVVAYGAVVFDGEPSYDALEGEWLTEGKPYVVLHRLAVADEMKHRGIAREFFLRVGRLALDRGVEVFRVDTHEKNRYMLRLVDQLGFTYCGLCRYGSGERRAFERILPF